MTAPAIQMTALPMVPGRLANDDALSSVVGDDIVLCASLFPFRVGREHWAERLAQVVALGYMAVDVYVPWNVHEPEPGRWDFSGERDIEHFLTLCADAGVRALVRPGPYICSEWDGGGLPAWLTLTEGLRVRQNEPHYLRAVDEWFERVLPILARQQTTRGGAVALIQLENELDFFDCDDPAGYVAHLRDAAHRHGIDVPLIACAGQGDIARATGWVPGVLPAVNLYPDDDSPEIEAQALYYVHELRRRGLPLLVTETNRLHRTLKRLVVTGARLLGPYLQTSGWNPNHGTAINNWGDLLGFMTHDYDFGGVIAPDGTIRDEGAEARILGGVVRALGWRISHGAPTGQASNVEHGLDAPPHALALAGGGELISLTRLADEPSHAVVACGPHRVEVLVPGQTCLLLVRGLPIPVVGATVALCSAELTALDAGKGGVELSFSTRGEESAIVLGVLAASDVTGDLDVTVEPGDEGLARLDGTEGTVLLQCETGTIRVAFVPLIPQVRHVVTQAPVVSVAASRDLEEGFAWQMRQVSGPAQTLERVGAYRGAGRYRSLDPLPAGTIGVVLRGAADVVSLEVPGASRAWIANGGSDVFLPFDSALTRDDVSLSITTRSWGHSNFDDPRLPSLRLGSQKGLSGAIAVTESRDWTQGWLVDVPEGSAVGVGDAPAPRCALGSWMSGEFPQAVRYRRVIDAGAEGAAVLHGTGLEARIDVAIDAVPVGSLTPLVPDLWLGPLRPGQVVELVVHRTWGEDAGSLELLTGQELERWSIESADTPELISGRDRTALMDTSLPVTVPPGSARWLSVMVPGDAPRAPESGDVIVRLEGRGLLITALVGDELLGRVWTQAPPGATLKGGRGDLFVVPRSFVGRRLSLLLENTTDEDAELLAARLGGPIDVDEPA